MSALAHPEAPDGHVHPSDIFKRLSVSQKEAMCWMWPNSERRWHGCSYGLNDPQPSVFGALSRRGLVTKRGGDGFATHYKLTPLGAEVYPLAIAAMYERNAAK
jgi:hypothetical protein